MPQRLRSDLLASARAGRGIAAADESAGTAAAVISEAFWRSAYRGDLNILGRRLTSDGIEYTVTGVMPRGFSGHSASSVDVWLPLATAMRSDPGWQESPFRNIVSVFGRLKDSVTVAVAAAQATVALNRSSRSAAWLERPWGPPSVALRSGCQPCRCWCW